MTVAVYAGSFDPPTHGHLDLIYRASRTFDRIIVGVGVNSSKKPLFETQERITLIRRCLEADWKESQSWRPAKTEAADPARIEVVSFGGLLVDFCAESGATVIVRGLRAVTDFEAELGIAHANASMVPHIDTFFLPTKPRFSFVSSSTVREIARHPSKTGWGNLHKYVPATVIKALREKFPDPTQEYLKEPR